MSPPTTILADDHVILLDGLRRLLEGHVEIVGTCNNGGSLLDETLRQRPELIITDISMPVMTGLEFLREMRRTAGEYRPRVIVLSMYGDEHLVSAAFRWGAMGFLPKHSAGEELIEAVGSVMSGQRYISHLVQLATTTDRVSAPPPHVKLSKRQRQVLRLVAAGRTMKQVAAELHLSRRTVEMHKYHMMRALGVGTTAELIQYFVRHEPAETHEQPALEL